ncbi:MAG: 16S rRNA (adenine(1518)-N(6)/adenine(1519)-N(6))-dimethyltransferase RsmA [Bacteroidetes bacterium]|nr:16S rRNA (adenine(1518)-N(6)/adenine(1519)-N(6))-dimethyltransferase RsmA [Bacteroidota bacterium]MDA0874800.1 16S rRNA (adenine(1518)-N(6)/adenine(1519)-N(6))-dimethyltransferase RsmA [Bacteroidota bacterium]
MLKPIKRLGQNFLQDPNTIRRIVDSLGANPTDTVVEIGPGTGALTRLLHERWPRFTAIEVDERSVDLLREEIPGLDIRHLDVLKVDWHQLAGGLEARRLHVIGNLPYYITSQILFSLLDAAPVVAEAVIMMQYEVAERLVATPRTKSYGILSVAVQLACQPELMFPVSRNVFYPKPDVRSAMVRLRFPEAPAVHSPDPAFLRLVIRTAFNQRRKTLRNSLSRLTLPDMQPLPESWAGRRAEELSPHDFVRLADYLAGRLSHLD